MMQPCFVAGKGYCGIPQALWMSFLVRSSHLLYYLHILLHLWPPWARKTSLSIGQRKTYILSYLCHGQKVLDKTNRSSSLGHLTKTEFVWQLGVCIGFKRCQAKIWCCWFQAYNYWCRASKQSSQPCRKCKIALSQLCSSISNQSDIWI